MTPPRPAWTHVHSDYLHDIPWPEGVEAFTARPDAPPDTLVRVWLTGTPHPGKELDPIFRRSEDGTTSLIDWNPK